MKSSTFSIVAAFTALCIAGTQSVHADARPRVEIIDGKQAKADLAKGREILRMARSKEYVFASIQVANPHEEVLVQVAKIIAERRLFDHQIVTELARIGYRPATFIETAGVWESLAPEGDRCLIALGTHVSEAGKKDGPGLAFSFWLDRENLMYIERKVGFGPEHHIAVVKKEKQ